MAQARSAVSGKRLWLGIDGCRAGWIGMWLDAQGVARWAVRPDLNAMLDDDPALALALVDIPIGLADGARECDRLARQRLGPRRSSVFSPPARATLAARDYREALRINRAHAGTGLSKQAWNIVPKIREADRLLQSRPALQGRLRESHPELAFASLNHGQPMQYNKRTAEGRRERLRVLRRYLPTVRSFVNQVLGETLRRDVQADDVLDALVLAILAREGRGRLATLPLLPPRDAKGLPMEMVYIA